MRTLYIECGTTRRNPVNSGIQRVVSNILSELQSNSVTHGFKSVPVEFLNGRFVIIDDTPPSAPTLTYKQHLMNVCIRLDLQFQNCWFTFLYAKIRNILKRFIKTLSRANNNDTVVHIMTITAEEQSEPMHGDTPILLLIDSSWFPGMWEDVERFRSAGGHVAAVLYDLIPFSHPETVADITRIAHTSWWSAAPLHLDSIICISQAVRKEFLLWQKTQKFERQIPEERVGYFYLGADLRTNDPVVTVLTETTPYYLIVGSLEPRKNHALALEAFQALWDEGYKVRLVIVGGYGWKSDAFLDRIYNHSEYNTNLFLIRDATDRDLSILYAKADGVIVPSIAEGFGLPIVEALQKKAKVFCSDIPIFREVAGINAIYFDPYNYESLSTVLAIDLNTINKKCQTENNQHNNWLGWKESASMLLSTLTVLSKGQ